MSRGIVVSVVLYLLVGTALAASPGSPSGVDSPALKSQRAVERAAQPALPRTERDDQVKGTAAVRESESAERAREAPALRRPSAVIQNPALRDGTRRPGPATRRARPEGGSTVRFGDGAPGRRPSARPDPFERDDAGRAVSTPSRSVPWEEGDYKPDQAPGRAGPGGFAPRDPFVRDDGGDVVTTPGGFAPAEKGTSGVDSEPRDPFVRDEKGGIVSTPSDSAPWEEGDTKPDQAPGPGPYYDRDSDTFVYEDGRRVRGSSPSGAHGRVNDKGDVVYDDGTMITRDPETGAVTVVHPDGTSETHAGRAPFYDAKSDTFVYGDGARARGTDPGGRRGKANPDGSIDYADGTRVHHDPSTGRTTIRHADGSTTVHDEHGGMLRTGPGMDTSRSSDGGTTVHDRESGVTARFGPTDSTYEEGGSKDDDDSSGSGGSSGGSGSGSSDSSGDGSGSGDSADSSSSDDDDDDESSSDSSDEDSDSDEEDSADSGDETDSGDDEGGAESYRVDDYGRGDGRPRAGGVVDDFVARRRGERRERDGGDCEGADDGSGPVSQPGRGERDGGCPPEAVRPSAEGEDRPGITLPMPTASTGGYGGPGDCFDPAGCDSPAPVRTIDPFDRGPVTNPRPE